MPHFFRLPPMDEFEPVENRMCLFLMIMYRVQLSLTSADDLSVMTHELDVETSAMGAWHL